MIRHKYGEFTVEQMEEYKKKLHKQIHWLLLYKDPAIEQKPQINFYEYFFWLMKKISGLNCLLCTPPELVELLATLEAAKGETKKDKFNFRIYRKLILDAHGLVDRVYEEVHV